MAEMEILLRQVDKGQKSVKKEVKLTVFKPEKNSPFNQLIITACPDWLDTTCSDCGKDAYPSKYYRGGKPTLVKIDSALPKVLCDNCRKKLQSKSKRMLMEHEIPPDPDKLVWHSRIEWSVNGDRWYGVSQRNIKPYSSLKLDKRELTIRSNKISNALYRGGTLKGKGSYDKDKKELSINVDSFNI